MFLGWDSPISGRRPAPPVAPPPPTRAHTQHPAPLKNSDAPHRQGRWHQGRHLHRHQMKKLPTLVMSDSNQLSPNILSFFKLSATMLRNPLALWITRQQKPLKTPQRNWTHVKIYFGLQSSTQLFAENGLLEVFIKVPFA